MTLLESARLSYQSGELERAEALCRQALQEKPNDPNALHLLGIVTNRLGTHGLAAALIRKAIAFRPDEPAFHCALGGVLRDQSRSGEAEQAYRGALSIEPEFVKAHAGLGAALLEQGRVTDAIASCRRAIELDPTYARAHEYLGVALLRLGEQDKAIGAFTAALDLRPDLAEAHSNILFAKHYSSAWTRQQLFDEARAWGARCASIRSARFDHLNRAEPERRLRVGYVSGDFHQHPVGRFFEPVLLAHDRQELEVFCYSNHRAEDSLTNRLRSSADHWRKIVDRDDQAVASMIREDAIDVLVDLSGHTGWNRLTVFARKPAPVQASWLGYFDTTGLPEMDYLIADPIVCPRTADPFHVEQIVRLPQNFICYAPPDESAEVGPLPAARRGHITFGCFNNIAKVTPEVVGVWAEILRSTPQARLRLKTAALGDESVRARYTAMFAGCGIAPERLELEGESPALEYLQAYNEVDVALDPFPFNGGTTSLDALWMGVPVISLAGDRFVSRMGASHLTAVGLSDLVGRTRQSYVSIARRIANDLESLAHLRGSLRERMLNSPLCDTQAFTRALESAYRDMWQHWCRTQQVAA